MTAAVKGAVTVESTEQLQETEKSGREAYMGRRRIWLIIIGILIAGGIHHVGSGTVCFLTEVDTAAVVGFEADALPQGPVDAGNPCAVENRMKAAGTPDPRRLRKMRKSVPLQWQRMRWQWRRAKQGAAAENAAKICRLLRRP